MERRELSENSNRGLHSRERERERGRERERVSELGREGEKGDCHHKGAQALR